jgi:catechol 2,3-dioxygenase-like lactoylglutathione lyase family enzyme
MALHRLTSVTIGVPNVAETAAYYEEFGLTRLDDSAGLRGDDPPHPADRPEVRFTTVVGGEQLRLVPSPRRRLVELGIGVTDPDDLDSAAARLAAVGVAPEQTPDALAATDPGTGVRVALGVAGPVSAPPAPVIAQNGPGRPDRGTARAEPVLRENPVRPRKLGHVVLGSTDLEASERFFIQGVGFKVSDAISGAASFLRCSTDHHNLLVQAAPVPFLHHTSWQVDDVDEIGRGATALLEKDPTRHVWGLGRHHIGSNFFWYLKDPAGNFSEYYADLDCIIDDQLWHPGVWDDIRALYSWGPPVPEAFLAPSDLAELMAAAHQP